MKPGVPEQHDAAPYRLGLGWIGVPSGSWHEADRESRKHVELLGADHVSRLHQQAHDPVDSHSR
jgi:hypothetical protein